MILNSCFYFMADIFIVRPGYFRWVGQDICRASSNITLVKTENLNILVDSGGVGEDKEIEAALGEHGLGRQDVNILVLTHHHPDHAGGIGLFSHAIIYDFAAKITGDKYEFWKEDKLDLTPDVTLIKTPGHTPECVSLIAKTDHGKVACVGDLWWSGGDNKLLLSWDKQALLQSREKIRKISDFIIPGHDVMVRANEAA